MPLIGSWPRAGRPDDRIDLALDDRGSGASSARSPPRCRAATSRSSFCANIASTHLLVLDEAHHRRQRQARGVGTFAQLQVDDDAVRRRVAPWSARASSAPATICAFSCSIAARACAISDSCPSRRLRRQLLLHLRHLRGSRGEFRSQARRFGLRLLVVELRARAGLRELRRLPLRASARARAATESASRAERADCSCSFSSRWYACALSSLARHLGHVSPPAALSCCWYGTGSMRNSTSPFFTGRLGSTGTSITRPVTRGTTCTT